MKERVLSAIILVCIIVPLTYLGGEFFSYLCAIIASLSVYELINIRESKRKLPFIIKLAAYVMVILFTLRNSHSIDYIYNIDYKMMAIMIFTFLLSIVFFHNNDEYCIGDALYILGSILFIGISYNLLIITRNNNIFYILYLFLISVITDIFAFTGGKLIGKHKLSPELSPNKTIEGLITGLIMGTIIPSYIYMTMINSEANIYLICTITLVLSLLGSIGDLVFSSIKRYYGKKDFSNLIPGHGGVLDRFDSMIFVVLGYVLFIGIL